MLTAADIALMNDSEFGLLVDQATVAIPEMRHIPAGTISKKDFYTLVMTVLPTTGFRAINAGRAASKPTLEKRLVSCAFLDADWEIDIAAVKASDSSPEAVYNMMKRSHLRSAFLNAAKQIYYGVSNDASGFPGIAAVLANSDDSMVVNAGGTTENKASSVFLMNFAPSQDQDIEIEESEGIRLVFGNDGEFEIGEINDCRLTDGSNNPLSGKRQSQNGYIGLQYTDLQAVVRICNLTEDTGKGLTDDLIYKAISKFPPGKKPNAMFMTGRSLEQLRNSRTATNATGVPAPTPEEVANVPIYETSAISNIEALLTAA